MFSKYFLVFFVFFLGGLMDTKSFLEILEASFKEVCSPSPSSSLSLPSPSPSFYPPPSLIKPKELEEAVWSFIISSLGRISSSLIDPASNEGFSSFFLLPCLQRVLNNEPSGGVAFVISLCTKPSQFLAGNRPGSLLLPLPFPLSPSLFLFLSHPFSI